MVIIGIDTHTRVHVAAALDEHGRVVEELKPAMAPSNSASLSSGSQVRR